jgi:PPK2 family polyphosphate:nucleotide phosphotransferase
MDIGRFKVDPGSKFKLKKYKPDDTAGMKKGDVAKAMSTHTEKLAALHDVLYAEHKRAVLIVLQGLDASGKDGTIKHVMSGVNPQGCVVTSFKQPCVHELNHDFLWRIHNAVPELGMIGIFNRSHYEDVLVTKVHKLYPKATVEQRYEQINNFEQMLSENGVHILKFFLHMSSDEQAARLDARVADPVKNWKYSAGDYQERQFWDAYQDAYEEALSRCSTKYAPWYVIPSDHKWFRNFAVSEIVIRSLAALKMQYPEASKPKAASQNT